MQTIPMWNLQWPDVQRGNVIYSYLSETHLFEIYNQIIVVIFKLAIQAQDSRD